MKKLTIGITFFAFALIFYSGRVFGQEATYSSDTIREKVKEKIEQAKNKPKAILGAVTDKTEDTLEVKVDSGEIQLVGVEPESVDFVKIGKTSSNIKFTDIAIGDYLIAMGYRNGNTVLNAKRVLLTEPPEQIDRKVVYGSISEINKKIVSIERNSGEKSDLEFGVSWSGPEIKEMTEGDTIIAIGDEEAGKIKVRTIEIVKATESTPTPTPESEEE